MEERMEIKQERIEGKIGAEIKPFKTRWMPFKKRWTTDKRR
jgi:hypothetical protein